ncbi:MAG: hypothetical protein V2A73_08750 [Pseudomonadota bacterium]
MTSALRDPAGARVALVAYGREYNYPACKLAGIKFLGGEAEWVNQVLGVGNLQAGLALQAAEQLREKAPDGSVQTKRGPTGPNEGETMPVLQPKEFSGLEPGAYGVRIKEIVEQPAGERKPGMQFDPKPQLQFQFVVLDDGGQDTDGEIRGWCNAVWGKKAKLVEWAQAILKGKCPKDDVPFDSDLLLNRKCDIVVEANAAGNSKVTKVFPFRTISATDDGEPS